MVKHTLYILPIILLAISCRKVDDAPSAKAARPFDGVIETAQEVDLGLSAKWAGYNVGASVPSECGSYFAWGETDVKNAYTKENYKFYDASSGKFSNVPGSILPSENDAATSSFGYGWYTPSPEDIQELIDNCSFVYASYNGVAGWVASSKVQGFEGKSIFFPTAGYFAGDHPVNVGVQSLFWTNVMTGQTESNWLAQNAFFSGTSLYLNYPKGAGGIVWCGYPVRAVRKFYFAIDREDCFVERTQTSLTFNVSGNSKWSVTAEGEGISAEPSSGEGAACVTLTFPENNTNDYHYYDIEVKSPEFAEAKKFRITQFCIAPDFKYDSVPLSDLSWDEVTSSLHLLAGETVEWTVSVLRDGDPVQGVSVSPESGKGSSTLNISLPVNYSMFDEAEYTVRAVTDNEKIPEQLRTIDASVVQQVCPHAPFGTLWGADFISAVKDSVSVDPTAEYYLVHNVKVVPKTPGTINTSGYLGKAMNLYFNAAQDGDALLGVEAIVSLSSTAGSSKKIAVYRNDELFDGSTMANFSTTDNMSGNFKVYIPEVKKGELIRLRADDSGNHKIYSLSWDLFKGVLLDRNGTVEVGGTETSLTFNVTSNTGWTASVSGAAELSSESGTGNAELTLTFPVNDTDDPILYNVTVSSSEADATSRTETFTVRQKTSRYMTISKSGTVSIADNVTSYTFQVSSNVTWTASVTGEGADVQPASGTGDGDVTVSFPANETSEIKSFIVTVSTENPAIEEKELMFKISQAAHSAGVKFGTTWGSSYLTTWKNAGFTADEAFTAEGLTSKTSHSISTGNSGAMRGNYSCQFTVGEAGVGDLSFYAYTSASNKYIVVKKNGDQILKDASKYSSTVAPVLYTVENITVVEGDVITITYAGASSNYRLYLSDTYPIIWKKHYYPIIMKTNYIKPEMMIVFQGRPHSIICTSPTNSITEEFTEGSWEGQDSWN